MICFSLTQNKVDLSFLYNLDSHVILLQIDILGTGANKLFKIDSKSGKIQMLMSSIMQKCFRTKPQSQRIISCKVKVVADTI